MKRKKNIILGVILTVALGMSACQPYKQQVVPFKLPSAYPNMTAPRLTSSPVTQPQHWMSCVSSNKSRHQTLAHGLISAYCIVKLVRLRMLSAFFLSCKSALRHPRLSCNCLIITAH